MLNSWLLWEVYLFFLLLCSVFLFNANRFASYCTTKSKGSNITFQLINQCVLFTGSPKWFRMVTCGMWLLHYCNVIFCFFNELWICFWFINELSCWGNRTIIPFFVTPPITFKAQRKTFFFNLSILSGLFCSIQYVEDNLGVMSVGFLLSSPSDAVIWRGPKKNGKDVSFLAHLGKNQPLIVSLAIQLLT